MIELKAAYFDGKTAAAHSVRVQVLEDALVILGEAPQKIDRKNLLLFWVCLLKNIYLTFIFN